MEWQSMIIITVWATSVHLLAHSCTLADSFIKCLLNTCYVPCIMPDLRSVNMTKTKYLTHKQTERKNRWLPYCLIRELWAKSQGYKERRAGSKRCLRRHPEVIFEPVLQGRQECAKASEYIHKKTLCGWETTSFVQSIPRKWEWWHVWGW